MQKHNYYPAGLNVQGKRCLIIGLPDDREFKEKSARLRESGADLTVVTPDEFSLDQITDQFVVFFCPKNMPDLVKKVAEKCRANRVLLCAIDQPAYCDVVNVSIYDNGRLRMTIGTGGAAPAVSRKIRLGLEKSLKNEPIEQFMDDLAALRKRLETEVSTAAERIPKLLAAADGFEFKAKVKFPAYWAKKHVNPLKRFWQKLFWAVAVVLMPVVVSADVVLVYTNPGEVAKAKPVLGTLTPDGVLVAAELAMAASGRLLVGELSGDVKEATLVRLDHEVNAALFRVGERVVNPDLQAWHKKNSRLVSALLPSLMPAVATEVESAFVPLAGPTFFDVTLNGRAPSKDVITMKTFLRKAKFNVELVKTSTEPVKSLVIEVASNPKLGFWNTARTLTPSDAPRNPYIYEYKSLAALKPGKKIVLPLEAHFIDDKHYEWTVTVRSSLGTQSTTFLILFN